MKQWQTPNDCLRAFPPYAKGRPVIIHFCLLSAPPSGASAINSNISFISSSSFSSSSSSYWLIPLLLKLDSENHFLTDFLYAIFFGKRIFQKKNSLYPSLSLSLSLFFFVSIRHLRLIELFQIRAVSETDSTARGWRNHF